VFLSLVLLNVSPSFANRYNGRIFLTVTNTNLSIIDYSGPTPVLTTPATMPGLSVGETFIGTYSYESPTIDGTFHQPNGLIGGILLPGVFNPLPPGYFADPTPYLYTFKVGQGFLTITGGQVGHFSLNASAGQLGINVTPTTFRLGCDCWVVNPTMGPIGVWNAVATGTIYVEAPSVPEPPTLLMLAAGIAALAIARRKREFHWQA